MVTFTVTRIILLIYAGISNVPITLWPEVLGKGLFFDLAVLAYLLPILLLADIVYERFRNKRWFSAMGFYLLVPPVFSLFFLICAEVVFWTEFHTRFNFIALDYLIYTNEVIRNIWQSYPILRIVAALGFVSAVVAWALSHRGSPPMLSAPFKMAVTFVAIGLPLLSARFVHFELMHRQGNVLAEEISGNGLFTLFAAARHNELDYDRFYATIPQERANQLLKQLGVEWTDDPHRRQYDIWGDDKQNSPLPSFIKRRPRHVVLISVEVCPPNLSELMDLKIDSPLIWTSWHRRDITSSTCTQREQERCEA